jgi:ATP-dependent DNA ligase
MTLPIPRTYAPTEAKLVDELPVGGDWQYEPKWDGFRCLAFRDGDKIDLMSKAGKPLARYFPEVVEMLLGTKGRQFMLDGELIISVGDVLSFDALQMRLHPAESRIRKLAVQTPAELMAFDLLEVSGKGLLEEPLSKRRQALEKFMASNKPAGLRLSPATADRKTAIDWLKRSGGALDGVIAKRLDLEYRSGERAMIKVKQQRTADCIVGGFRYAPGFTGDAPGGPSRWANARSAEWQPLKPKLVVEVRYDQVTGRRFRHGTGFLRWRPDKSPKQCTFQQLAPELRPSELKELFGQ